VIHTVCRDRRDEFHAITAAREVLFDAGSIGIGNCPVEEGEDAILVDTAAVHRCASLCVASPFKSRPPMSWPVRFHSELVPSARPGSTANARYADLAASG
jgi:hypothetical protein